MTHFYRDILQDHATPIGEVPLESTIHGIYEGKFIVDQLLMGVDEDANAIILADKSNPAKVKPYTPIKIELLNEVHMESYFDRLSETPPTAVLVSTRKLGSGPSWLGSTGSNIQEGTGVGFEPPPNFNNAQAPHREKQWHGYGCRCLTGAGGSLPCGGFGTWAYGDPVYS